MFIPTIPTRLGKMVYNCHLSLGMTPAQIVAERTPKECKRIGNIAYHIAESGDYASPDFWRELVRECSKRAFPKAPPKAPQPPTIEGMGKATKHFNRLAKQDKVLTEHIYGIIDAADAWLVLMGESHRDHRVTWACQDLALCDTRSFPLYRNERTEENPAWWRFRMAVNKLDMACNG